MNIGAVTTLPASPVRVSRRVPRGGTTVPHGERVRYVRGCRCKACIEANNAYHRDLRRRHRETPETIQAKTTPEHGTYSRYVNSSCRCRPCRDARTAQMRDYRARLQSGCAGGWCRVSRALDLAREALINQPTTCRYHEDRFDFMGFGLWGEPRCQSCRQPWRVVRALKAIEMERGGD